MCCGTQHQTHHHGAFSGCGTQLPCGPCFCTKEEKVAWLEQCLEDLRLTAKHVEERITKMKKQ